jgi:hypothetical protein
LIPPSPIIVVVLDLRHQSKEEEKRKGNKNVPGSRRKLLSSGEVATTHCDNPLSVGGKGKSWIPLLATVIIIISISINIKV